MHQPYACIGSYGNYRRRINLSSESDGFIGSNGNELEIEFECKVALVVELIESVTNVALFSELHAVMKVSTAKTS